MSIDVATEPSVAQLDTGGAAVQYRYPGSPPFQDTELDRRLFRGRAEEADTVLHSILSSDLFLLYAVSGMGKSSLLNAGVMHRLRERGHWPVSVRLNDPSQRPVVEIREQLEDAANGDLEIELLWGPGAGGSPGPDTSLWDLLASLEVWRHNDLQRPVIVLDQFEELFTLGWDDAVREEFIRQFGEVVRGYRLHSGAAPNGRGAPPDVKFVLVIREDHLGELEALATDVPQIMRNRFRLGPLDPVQAAAAIREPARVRDGRLDSQPFAYTEAATDEILDFLRTTTERGEAVRTNRVDPPQLQIVCQYVERAILPTKGTPPPGDVVQIDAADLGGREGLERILGDFYRRTLQTFPASQQKAVRQLCERGLVNPAGRRLSLEEGEIGTEFGVTTGMLHQLVDERLLRADPRVGSVYYELAHDTLVPPIRAYAEEDAANRRRRRRRWIAVAAALVGIVLVSLLAFTLGSDSGDEGTSAQSLSVGETVTGSVDEPGADVLFSVRPDDDQVLLVSVRPVAAAEAAAEGGDQDGAGVTLNAAIELAAGGVQRQQDQLGAGQREQMVVPPVSESSAPQQIAVTSFDSTTGPFEITVEEAVVTDLASGSTGFGTIAVAGDLAVFRIEISGGTPIAVDIIPTLAQGADGTAGESAKPRLDVQVELLDPRGVRAAIDTDAAGRPERAQVGGVDGQHLVVVRGYQSTTGQFDVEADRVGRALAAGEPETTEITGNGVAEFTYDLAQDGTYALVTLEPDPEFDPVLDIDGPSGEPQSIDGGGDGGAEHAVLGPKAGSYVLTVSGFETDEGPSTGEFTLDVSAVERALTLGQPETGETDGSDVVAFSLDVPVGGPSVVVTVEPDPALDAALGIIGPDGELPPADSNLEGGPEAVFLSAPGSYLVAAGGFGPGTFELLATPAQPRQLQAGDSDSATDFAVYSVEVTSGEDLQFVVEPSSPDSWVEIEVYDPTGLPVDYLVGDLGEPVTVELEDTPGVHQLVVRSLGDARDFTVTVTGEVDTDGDAD